MAAKLIDKAFHHIRTIGLPGVDTAHDKDQPSVFVWLANFKLSFYFGNRIRYCKQRNFKASETGAKMLGYDDIPFFMKQKSIFQIGIKFRKGVRRAICDLNCIILMVSSYAEGKSVILAIIFVLIVYQVLIGFA